MRQKEKKRKENNALYLEKTYLSNTLHIVKRMNLVNCFSRNYVECWIKTRITIPVLLADGY